MREQSEILNFGSLLPAVGIRGTPALASEPLGRGSKGVEPLTNPAVRVVALQLLVKG